jgi:hypothetical protein
VIIDSRALCLLSEDTLRKIVRILDRENKTAYARIVSVTAPSRNFDHGPRANVNKAPMHMVLPFLLVSIFCLLLLRFSFSPLSFFFRVLSFSSVTFLVLSFSPAPIRHRRTSRTRFECHSPEPRTPTETAPAKDLNRRRNANR